MAPAKSRHNTAAGKEANVAKKPKSLSGTQSPSQKETPEKAPESSQRLSKETDYKDWGRNPFVPEKSSIKEVNLSGIVWDDKDPKAIINGEIVSIGDKIGEGTVKSIQQDRVILNDGAKDIEYQLEE